MGERLVSSLQRAMLRTGRGPLRPVWRLAHEAVARAVGLYVRGSERRSSVYVRTSLGVGDPVYGLSDIDLALTLPPDAASPHAARVRVWRRWQRLCRALPRLSRLMLDLEIFDLPASSAEPVLTHGLDGGAPAPVYGRGPAASGPKLQERPGLYGPLYDWRRLVGPERDGRRREWNHSERTAAAWLELQFWWRQAFRACLDPPGPRKPYLCVKLVAEPARILLWLVHGERIDRREEVLERALRLMPEEEAGLRPALEVLRRLPDARDAPVQDALRSLVRQSSRIAELLLEQAGNAGITPVRLLAGDRADPQLLPLADWRARAVPAPFEPDESFAVMPGEPSEADALGAAAIAGSDGPYPALRSDDLLVLAARKWSRSRLRGAQCAVTDPVSFALLDGRERAEFANVPGWSAHDSAERAVAEHRGWLDEPPDAPEPNGRALARLLAAARAAQFWASIREGEPALPLTLADAARTLAGRGTAARSIAEQASGEYLAYRHESRTPSGKTVAALREEVRRLPAYGVRAGA
jgi:hypothetical protein